MKKNGFVTSALLYGILSLFLVLMMGTISIISSRKVTNDKIKQSALDDVQALVTDESCFGIVDNEIVSYDFDDDDCSRTVYIPEGITSIDSGAFKHVSGDRLKNVTIPSSVTSIKQDAFEGQDNVLFILKNPSVLLLNDITNNYSAGDYWGAPGSTYRID